MKMTFNDRGRCLICLQNPCRCKTIEELQKSDEYKKGYAAGKLAGLMEAREAVADNMCIEDCSCSDCWSEIDIIASIDEKINSIKG